MHYVIWAQYRDESRLRDYRKIVAISKFPGKQQNRKEFQL